MMSISRHTRNASLLSIVLLIAVFVLLGFSQEQWVDIAERKADNLVWRMSMSFAYTCLILLAITMSIGPVNLIMKRPNPTHNPSRRAFGVAAGIMGLAHLGFAITIHSDGWDILHQFIHQTDSGVMLRIDRHGIANYLGLFQASILLMLIIASTNGAIKRLGLKVWKYLQRLVYLALIAIILHGLIYQIIEARSLIIRLIFIVIMSSIIVLQFTGVFLQLRSQRINTESI